MKEDFRYQECGLDNVGLRRWPGYRCKICRIAMPVLGDPDRMTVAILEKLLEIGRNFNADEVAFIQSFLRSKTEDLAGYLEVSKEELVRWKNAAQLIPDDKNELLVEAARIVLGVYQANPDPKPIYSDWYYGCIVLYCSPAA